MSARRILFASFCGAAWLAMAPCASAQTVQPSQSGQNVPNALQGFSQNRDKPVDIKAATLEVRDKDKVATFSGDVVVTQGDTTLRSKALKVFYDQEDNAKNLKTAEPGPTGQQQIRKLDATGGVTVTQKDQKATGDIASFDMRTNTVTMKGNVIVTQGPNILRGDRLVVDLTTGVSRVESDKGRVQMLIDTTSLKDKEKEGKDPKTQKTNNKEAPAPRRQSPKGLY